MDKIYLLIPFLFLFSCHKNPMGPTPVLISGEQVVMVECPAQYIMTYTIKPSNTIVVTNTGNTNFSNKWFPGALPVTEIGYVKLQKLSAGNEILAIEIFSSNLYDTGLKLVLNYQATNYAPNGQVESIPSF